MEKLTIVAAGIALSIVANVVSGPSFWLSVVFMVHAFVTLFLAFSFAKERTARTEYQIEWNHALRQVHELKKQNSTLKTMSGLTSEAFRP